MDPTLKYFLIGAAGGLAPEAVRLYSIATSGVQFKFSWFYVITSVVFAALSGLVAILLPSENGLSAFYAGISTPVLVNTAMKKARNAIRKKKAAKSGVAVTEVPRSRFDAYIDAL
jgi:hypothetical protein